MFMLSQLHSKIESTQTMGSALTPSATIIFLPKLQVFIKKF